MKRPKIQLLIEFVPATNFQRDLGLKLFETIGNTAAAALQSFHEKNKAEAFIDTEAK